MRVRVRVGVMQAGAEGRVEIPADARVEGDGRTWVRVRVRFRVRVRVRDDLGHRVRVVLRSGHGGGGASGQSARVGGSPLTCASRPALPPLPALLARPNPLARAHARPLAALAPLLRYSGGRALCWRALRWRALRWRPLCGRARRGRLQPLPGRLPSPAGRLQPPPGRFSRRLLRWRLLALRAVGEISVAGDWSSVAGDFALAGEEGLQLGGPTG